MDDLLKQILSELTDLKSDVKDIKESQNRIESKFDELESKNATKHTELLDNIKVINKDVKFIKHKLHKTEEEMFDIKDRLKLVK